METRAHYVLIGIFTILGFIGILAFSLWFARVELDRQFAYYDVKFTSVSGLARASDVRFAGLPVGQVVAVRLSPDNDGTILVRLEVVQNTPVRMNSIATIESQGLTGVSYVGISAGDAHEPLLRDVSDLAIPLISPGRSMIQSLSEDAPELVSEVLEVVRDLRKLINDENVGRIDNILINVDRASEGFAQSLDDFSVVAGAISGFAIEISNFNVMLEDLTTNAEALFETADQTLVSIQDLTKETQTTVASGAKALEQTTRTLAKAETYIDQDLATTTKQLSDGLQEARAQIASLSNDAHAMLSEFKTAGETATARLTEAKATIKATDAVIEQLDETLITMDKASINFDLLVTVDGAALVAEARAALAPIAEATKADLPGMIPQMVRPFCEQHRRRSWMSDNRHENRCRGQAFGWRGVLPHARIEIVIAAIGRRMRKMLAQQRDRFFRAGCA